ncbi:cytoplasmic dynein 1 light intermediate chain 1-like isoform X2 [Lagopus leucura]|nr:cytoplasmic dynein 1 light intermediate chain 1-like isoform X2 [Lagopus leucura]XP_042748170.1 cytoplasmic dynein 1 light intermediate chain 1-like isoform X2 [Lagopus leucura]
MESNSLKGTLVMLVVDMSRPWTAMDSLQKWASVVREHIDKLKIPPEEMKEMEQKLVRDFQEYVEPGEDFPASPQRRSTSVQEDKDGSVILPLGADTLTCNLGIPVVVVCTKCDAIGVLQKEHDYRDEHFDFIQSHIRRFCLQCILEHIVKTIRTQSFALIVTSLKEYLHLYQNCAQLLLCCWTSALVIPYIQCWVKYFLILLNNFLIELIERNGINSLQICKSLARSLTLNFFPCHFHTEESVPKSADLNQQAP